jgi:hypothetical protein
LVHASQRGHDREAGSPRIAPVTAPSPELTRGAQLIAAEQSRIDATGAKIAADQIASEKERKAGLAKATRFVSAVPTSFKRDVRTLGTGAKRGSRALLSGFGMRPAKRSKAGAAGSAAKPEASEATAPAQSAPAAAAAEASEVV